VSRVHIGLYWHWIACIYHKLVADVLEAQADWWTEGTSQWVPPAGLLAASPADHYWYSLYWSIGLTCQINLPVRTREPMFRPHAIALIVSIRVLTSRAHLSALV
jgi:hypothetical protein